MIVGRIKQYPWESRLDILGGRVCPFLL